MSGEIQYESSQISFITSANQRATVSLDDVMSVRSTALSNGIDSRVVFYMRDASAQYYIVYNNTAAGILSMVNNRN